MVDTQRPAAVARLPNGAPVRQLFRRPGAEPGTQLEDTLRHAGLDVRPIPATDQATPARLRAAVAGRQGPLLLRGLADGWPARARWAPARLADEHADRVVTALMDLPGEGVLFPQDQQHYQRSLPFPQFVAAMLTASPDAPCYLAYQRADEIFPPDDYDFGALLGDLETDGDTRVWIGSAGTRSMLHSDLKDNLFCQIWGEKHIVLVPWEDSVAAYPFPDNIVNSRLDLANVDLARFPRLADTVLYAATAGPGDVLYMPRGWWHDIRAQTASVSLNHWFGPPLELRHYARLLMRLGPRCWWSTLRDFVRTGVLGREEAVTFFFSPPSTGKRLFDALRWGDFSRGNDPTGEA